MSTAATDEVIDDLIEKCSFTEAAKLIGEKYPEEVPARYQLAAEIADTYEKKKQEVLNSDTDPQWSEQCHSSEKEKYKYQIHYRVDEKHQLYARFNCIVATDLLPSVLAVMNESNLYDTWMPSYKFPFRLGLRSSEILAHLGRSHQVIRIVVDMPPPLQTRQCLQHAVAVDGLPEGIFIRAVSPSVDKVKAIIPDYKEDIKLPNTTDVDVEVNMWIRRCPIDHALYKKDDDAVLLTIVQTVDAHVSFVPPALISFVTRQVLRRMLLSLLQVAEEVKSGKREQHKKQMEEKPELYDWVLSRLKEL